MDYCQQPIDWIIVIIFTILVVDAIVVVVVAVVLVSINNVVFPSFFSNQTHRDSAAVLVLLRESSDV